MSECFLAMSLLLGRTSNNIKASESSVLEYKQTDCIQNAATIL